jgi:hypothetical protein
LGYGGPGVIVVNEMGSAEDAPSLRKGSWPIRKGYNYQSTDRHLIGFHGEDVTSEEARRDRTDYAVSSWLAVRRAQTTARIQTLIVLACSSAD